MTPQELRDEMDAAGWSVRRLAVALGVNKSTVTRWLAGERGIPPYLGAALATIRSPARIWP